MEHDLSSAQWMALQVAWGSCNASKCNDEVAGWLRRRRLDERAFLLRHLEIRTALQLQVGAEPAVEPDVREQRG